TAEAIQVDTTRGFILSPNENNNYQIISYQPTLGTTGVFDFDMNSYPGGIDTGGSPVGFFDAAAEDCSTGIAVAPVEFGTHIMLLALPLARFHAGSGFCSLTTTQACRTNIDCPSGETCPNGSWAPGRCTGTGGTNIGCAVNSDCVIATNNYGPCDPFYGA